MPHGLLLSKVPVSNSCEQPIPAARRDETELRYRAIIELSLTHLLTMRNRSEGVSSIFNSRFYLCMRIPVNPSAHFPSPHLIDFPMCITSHWRIITIQVTDRGKVGPIYFFSPHF